MTTMEVPSVSVSVTYNFQMDHYTLDTKLRYGKSIVQARHAMTSQWLASSAYPENEMIQKVLDVQAEEIHKFAPWFDRVWIAQQLAHAFGELYSTHKSLYNMAKGPHYNAPEYITTKAEVKKKWDEYKASKPKALYSIADSEGNISQIKKSQEELDAEWANWGGSGSSIPKAMPMSEEKKKELLAKIKKSEGKTVKLASGGLIKASAGTHMQGANPAAFYADEAAKSTSSIESKANKLPGMMKFVDIPCTGDLQDDGKPCNMHIDKAALKNIIMHINDSHSKTWDDDRLCNWLDELHDTGVVNLELHIKDKEINL